MREVIFYEPNELVSHESVSGFSPKVRIRVIVRIRVAVGFSVNVFK